MPQIVRRTIPYSYLNPEALEDWLEEKAREGYFLTDYTPTFLVGYRFERRPPAQTRYRVRFFQKEPSTEEREAAAAQGWKFLMKYGKAYLFQAEDPHAPDLRRNLEALADLRREARRRSRNTLLITSAIILLLILFEVWNIATGAILDDLLISTASYDPFVFWVFLLSPLALPVILLLELWNHTRMPKGVDPPLPRKRSKRSPVLRNRTWALRQVFASLLCLFLLLQPLLPKLPLYAPVSLTQAEWDALPYPVLQDLEPQSTVSSMVFRGHHLLAPTLLEIQQNTTSHSGHTYRLHIYQTKNQWIARWFATECLSYFTHPYSKNSTAFETASLPQHDLDFAAYYTVTAPPEFPSSFTQHILILREGDTVVVAEYNGAFDIISLFPQYASALHATSSAL